MRQNIFLLFACSMFIFASCSNEKQSEIVAEKFLEAYTNGQYDEAKQYSTRNTQRMVNLASALAKHSKEKPKPVDYEVIDCREVGDKATVKYRLKGSSTNETMFLVKRGEHWLVGIE